MVSFTKSQLCYAGKGTKVHIRSEGPSRTYCGRGYAGELSDLDSPGLIGMTEKAEELCKTCLRVFKASKFLRLRQ